MGTNEIIPKGFQLENGLPEGFVEEGSIPSTVPSHENFLQRAIKQSRIPPFGGTSITAAVPTTGEEAMDLGKVGLRTLIPDTPGLVGLGSKMVDPRPIGGLPEPTSEYGQNLEASATVAQLLHLGGAIGGLLKETRFGKGIGGFFKDLKGAGIKGIEKDISATKGNISTARSEADTQKSIHETLGKIETKHVESQGKELAYEAGKGVKKAVQETFDTAKSGYRKMIQESHPEEVNVQDLHDVLDRVASNKGIGKVVDPNTQTLILDNAERALLGLKGEMASNLPKPGTWETPKELTSISSIKNFKNRVFGALKGRSDLEAEFMSEYGNMLEEKGLSQFSDATEGYRTAYAKLRASKPLTSGTYTQAAKGTIPQSKMEDLGEIEKKVGVDFLKGITNKQAGLKSEYRPIKSEAMRKYTMEEDAYGLMQDRLADLEGKLGLIVGKQAGAQKSLVSAAKWGIPVVGGLVGLSKFAKK